MAGKFGKIYKTVWQDPDFLALSIEAQHVYMVLTSSEQTSFAGVTPLAPGRFMGLASNMTDKKFKSAIRELERQKYIILDKTSLEILIRTFIKWDESLRNRNLSVAVARAIERVYSRKLRDSMTEELAKLLILNPELVGWEVLADHCPAFFQALSEHVISDPGPESSGSTPEGSSQDPSQDPPEDPSQDPYEDPYPIRTRYPLE